MAEVGSATESPPRARDDIDRVLIDRETIARRVKELAEEIHRDLAALDDGNEIVIVPVLTGALIFVADLIRHLPHKIRIDVVVASSYAGATTVSRGGPSLEWFSTRAAAHHVLLVDDILDSGRTIRDARAALETQGARSVRACVLLRKTIPSALSTPCEYIGFDIPDEFVVGYGLDYDGLYRNLPEIGVLKGAVLAGTRTTE